LPVVRLDGNASGSVGRRHAVAMMERLVHEIVEADFRLRSR
jgi:hypothetical protein